MSAINEWRHLLIQPFVGSGYNKKQNKQHKQPSTTHGLNALKIWRDLGDATHLLLRLLMELQFEFLSIMFGGSSRNSNGDNM